jgi:hypothetical protein
MAKRGAMEFEAAAAVFAPKRQLAISLLLE